MKVNGNYYCGDCIRGILFLCLCFIFYATALLYTSALHQFFFPFDFLTCDFFITRFLFVFTKQLFLIYLIPSSYGKHLCSTKLAIYYGNQMLNLTSCNFIVCSDFLTRSYDVGGVVSVMALSSLFVLMTQYGLEYPNFYEKLYALLVPSIFMAKHRARFFQVNLC